MIKKGRDFLPDDAVRILKTITDKITVMTNSMPMMGYKSMHFKSYQNMERVLFLILVLKKLILPLAGINY